jgi:predicted transcriptional regulator
MHRTTISLPDELAAALERESRRRSVPASAIAREALASYLGFGAASDRRTLPFAAVGRSGHTTTARDIDDLLAEEWDGGSRDR